MTDYETLLSYISPDVGYDEWVRVGMALKAEGAPFSTWDDWSSKGNKYNQREMQSKWNSFRRGEVTGGTLYHIACQYGFNPGGDDPMVGHYDLHNLLLDEVHLDPVYGSVQRVPGLPRGYDGRGEMLEYLTTLFDESDYVGFCSTAAYNQKKGKWEPAGTVYSHTAGQIIERLRAGRDGFGKPNEEAGIWVRFNPLDGQGDTDTNVTRWKHCLIESDDIPIEQQWSLIQSMHLPCTFVINSGGKSLHAIVKIDAENAQQYRDRVNELYKYAEQAGFKPDPQDKNASRYSRLPGARRGAKVLEYDEHGNPSKTEPIYQYIVARNIGEASYQDWLNWRQEQADDLPEDISLAEVWDNPPPLKDELIPGILRTGHKMLIAGPSKAGKSFLLMNLAISLAEGVEWLGIRCKQGRVCYVNLELDSASCIHRFKEIYEKRGLNPEHINAIDIWNLRGHAVPMDRLASILIHRFKDKKYVAVIIDPIYKVITGDENNATEMSQFCSYFDKVATELSVAMIYCHHHSKGAIDKYDNAMDRSSGSGVFARDPDAILDMTEVKTDGCEANYRKLNNVPDDAVLTGWEFAATLREFKPMPRFRAWFHYPVHELDANGDLKSAAKNRGSKKGIGKDQSAKSDLYKNVADALEITKGINGDTAIPLVQAGGRKANFSTETDFECATVNGMQLVHYRLEDEIYYKGRRFYRTHRGSGGKWLEDMDEGKIQNTETLI